MAQLILTGVFDVGNDVLRVEGTLDGVAVVAHGWVSATTGFATAVQMTNYCAGLFAAKLGLVQGTPQKNPTGPGIVAAPITLVPGTT